MDALLLLILTCSFGLCLTETTKYLNNCSEVNVHTLFTIEENIGNSSVMYNISNVDNDTFYVNKNDFVSTRLDRNFGIIELIKPLDYEKVKLFQYNLTCKYRYSMNIQVRNIIEGSLSFENSTYKAHITSDQIIGSVVIPVVKIKYSDSNPSDIKLDVRQPEFLLSYINPAEYKLQLKKLLTKRLYKFNVTAYLEKFPNKNGTAVFIISVGENYIPKICKACENVQTYKIMSAAFGTSTAVLALITVVTCCKLSRINGTKV
ncbi:FAT1_2_3 [Mytilus coruscus]|uniref:FAT1_2_3 n=1 Tax=Mytilus coruscus TaxID=42192 RepID=A0A6J8A7T5_MYTCO|nr:FAT1_2_3 [Mytilus coruscus]